MSDATASTVTLGDVEFDPVAIQDFRLSVEGTSGVGKSNTLAVVLEDLADVTLPTLVIERLGALTPVRLEDEDLVVVGARQEEGVDLAVGLEDLDHLGSWVLDRGMKILLDISTYADYEDEKSRIHLAAARALRSLNDRAHEKYRAGDRTKSLLVVDEAHYLAPKDSAPEPALDKYVNRCRGQLIKASTEGGNKGVSIVVGYQRRAFLHNGVIQLAQDFVAHRPGDEDIDRTADALRCSEDDLASLQTGEILARGTAITNGDLIGPTHVRKRHSPDPREDTFELPDTPDELEGVLEEIQAEVEAERERRSQHEDELEQLREENERLREEKAELEQELADVDRLGSALEKLSQANGPSAAQDVGEGVADLQDRVEELKQRRDELLDERSDALDEATYWEEQAQAYEERVADLEAEVQELRAAFEGAASEIASLAETFQVDVDLNLEGTYPDDSTQEAEPARANGGTSTAAKGGVQSALLSEFQEDAVDRIISQVEALSDRQKRLLKYIEARGKTIGSQKEWGKAALGLQSKPSGSAYEDMRALIDQGFVKKNNNGSVRAATRDLVEAELGVYDVDETTVDETYRELLRRVQEVDQ